ncbi:P-loop NTPase [Thermaurantiacus sp.]
MNAFHPLPRPGAGPGPFLGFATDAESRRLLGMAAAAHGWSAPDIRDGNLEAVQTALESGPAPGFLVIDLSATRAPLPAVNALADVCPEGTRVIAIGTQNDIALYRGLRALGVEDYLLKPLDRGLLDAAIRVALERDGRMAPEPTTTSRRAPVAAFVGSRGGAGTTALAAAVSALLAADGQRVTLLDLDFQGGSLGDDLDCEASPVIVQLLESPDRFDPVLLAQAFRRHALGFRVLAADAPIELSLTIESDALLALVAAASEDTDLLIIDLPRWLDRARRAVLRTVDHLVIVTPPTLAGLRDTCRMASLAAGLRAGQMPMIVVNREGASAAELPRTTFEDTLGLPVAAWLPEEPRAAARAAEVATTLATAAHPAGLGRGLATLAAHLGGRPRQSRRREGPAGWLWRRLRLPDLAR